MKSPSSIQLAGSRRWTSDNRSSQKLVEMMRRCEHDWRSYWRPMPRNRIFWNSLRPVWSNAHSPVASGENLAASLHAGLTSAFSAEEAVVMGDGNHSVLKQLARTMVSVPRVSLREPTAEGPEPIVRPASADVPQPESDSRYRIDGEIARGGMGAIFKGRDTDLGRDLAIKVLLDSHKDKPEIIQRFVEEAQIGGQLQHPGIAPIYELGQFPDRRPFFAMKLVKGETLSKLLADRRDTTEDRGKFIGIFEQICQTMAYAHSRGVIHRDLKPANIMVGAFGEVQVMDWGLAKVLASGGVADEKKAHDKLQGQSIIQTLRSQTDSDVPQKFGTLGSHTQLGSVMGTPAYMPPEQALGEIDHLDERADVFGLGAILCEILTGKPPYSADDGTLLFRMASRGELTDCFLRLDDSGADHDLVELTKQCLELEPADRPRNARVLAERISEYLASVETRLRETEIERATQAERVVAESRQVELQRRSASQLRKLVAVLAGVALVAASAFGTALVANQRANQLAITALKNEATANFFANEATAKAKLASENASRAESEADLARKEAERTGSSNQTSQ